MKSQLLLLLFVFMSLGSMAQINVEYDKKRDFSIYKTYSYGESQISSNKEEPKKINPKILDKWIKKAIDQELGFRGLKRVDSVPDIMVTYAMLSSNRSKQEQVFRTPSSADNIVQPNQRIVDYTESDLIVDLNDRGGNLIWRVNSVTTLTSAEGESMIDLIIEKGLKKFGKKPKGKKK